MPIFGITASSNQFAKLGDFSQIATTTVGSGGASEITFSSIPQTYTHLQIRIIAKQNDSATLAGMSMWFNSDTARNYPRHELYGDGASAASGGIIASSNGQELLFYAGSSSQFGPAVVDILDYTNTNKYKTSRSICGVDNSGSGYALFTSGFWLSTSAINTITIASNGSTLSQYSSFALYGIKG